MRGDRPRRPQGRHCLCQGQEDRPGRGRPGSAALRRHRRRSGGGRHQGLRSDQVGRAPGRLQGLHQGSVQGEQYPDRSLRALQRRGRREGLRPQERRTNCCESRRARRRQRRGRGRERAGGRSGHRHDVRRRAGRACVGNRGRGMPDRRGSLVLCAVRWRDRHPACFRARPQARRRRRQGSQHRRHGRLLAGADHDRRHEPARDGRDNLIRL